MGAGLRYFTAPAVAPKHFSHTDHKARGIDVDRCEACHSIDAKGQVLAPAAQGHAPCLDAKCHATDFLAVGQKALDRPHELARCGDENACARVANILHDAMVVSDPVRLRATFRCSEGAESRTGK